MYEPWQQYEIDFIRDVAGIFTTRQIAGKLERTLNSIRYMAQRIGVNLDRRKCRRWTANELSLFPTHTDRQISEMTGRTIGAVQTRRCFLRASNNGAMK